jgi:hypothetical protein
MPQVFLHLDIRGAKGSGVGVLVLDEEKGIIVGADSGPFSFPLAFSIPADDFTMSVRRVQLPSGRGTVEVQLRPIRVVE